MLVLVLDATEAGDVVEGAGTVDLVLTPAPSAGVEATILLEFVTDPAVLLAPITDTDEPNEVIVVPDKPPVLPAVVVLVAPRALVFPSVRIAALYKLSAAASALLTAVMGILYFVPEHVVCIVCKGAVRNSG